MKRFLLFAGENYYPGGGWSDFKNSFSTIEKAMNELPADVDWAHIVDSNTGIIQLTWLNNSKGWA